VELLELAVSREQLALVELVACIWVALGPVVPELLLLELLLSVRVYSAGFACVP
jgi:hypothetical protein